MAKTKTVRATTGRATPRKAGKRETGRVEIEALRQRVAEVEEALDAIRAGEVDALVINGPQGARVYTLKDADRPYRVVIENMKEGAVTVREDGLVLYANTQFAAMLGVPLDSLVGSNLFDQATPSGREALRKLTEEARNAAASAAVEFFGAEDVTLETHMSLAPMRIDGVHVLSGVVADVTAEKRTEAERARLAAAVYQAVDGVMILNAAGEAVYANPACSEITGYREEDILGVTAERMGGEIVAGIRAAIDTQGQWKGHVSRARKDGTPLELEASVAPLKTPSGEVANFIVLFRDVTHAMKLEQKIRQMERTEALGRLAGGVAHDLNNILLPIIINAELLLSEADPGTTRHDMLKNVLQAANRQKDLVRKILSFTRRTKRAVRVVRFTPILDEALKLLKPSLPASVELRRHVDAKMDTLHGDPTELHELVTNLATNAIDAMVEGRGVIDIALSDVRLDVEDNLLDLKPGTYLKLTVSDTGCGISETDLERIFDPFFTTKEPGKGTGIGLSVVRGIVKNHGGAITVASRVKCGTTVTVMLPAAVEATVSAEIGAGETAAEAGPKRVLVVDDEDIVLETMRQAMTKFGHRPTAVRDAAGALALFRSGPEHFDLALIDQTMPQMSGLELAAQLRKIRPGLPIILATGYSKAVDDRTLHEAGVQEIVMKPISLKDLAAAVTRALALGDKNLPE